jgi:tripartite-type tricarboxylate transporter receptor subunit TctC
VTSPRWGKTTEIAMIPSRIFLSAILAAVIGQTNVNTLPAQTYPNRPIAIVVGFNPGGGIDIVTRVIAHHLGTTLNQTVVVENRPGANSAIAAAYVARAAPDGYTLITGGGFYWANPGLMRSISYNPAKDFVPISQIGGFPYMLVVHPQVPAKSIAELIGYANAHPGQLSFATSSSSGVVTGETFKRWAGIDITHVPYKSAPPAINDVIGGRVSMMFADVTTALPHVNAATLRGLAVTTLERSALLPNLPSLHEEGLTGFDVASRDGIWAPANTPKDIIFRLNIEVRRIIDDPGIRAQFAAMGFETHSSSPEEMALHAKTQLAKWSKMIKDAGIEPQ